MGFRTRADHAGMTSNRSEAYGRVMRTLDTIGASKLHAHEQALIRDTADALFFCERLETDEAALDAMAAVRDLGEAMLAGDRLMPETLERLVADVEGCGPEPVPA
jgi:DNA mismatch repair ATPase MutL